MRGSAPHPEAQRIFNIPRRRFSGSISGKISQGPQPPQAVPKAPLTDFSRLCFEAASDGDIYSFEPSPFPREGAEGMGSFRLTTFHQNGGKTLKRPLAYITAAWCGEPDTDMELAARYCRMAYEAGFSPTMTCGERSSRLSAGSLPLPSAGRCGNSTTSTSPSTNSLPK